MSQQSNKNPASLAKKHDRTRVPMSVPELRLEVPEIPGYHLHWMLGTPSRIARAEKGGYTFVNEDEADIRNTSLGGDISKGGSTDMGSRVSIVAGSDTGDDGGAQRLYLMKIPLEYWEADQAQLEAKNEQVASTLRGGQDVGSNTYGNENRYIPEAARQKVSNLFTPKPRRI